MVLSGLIGQAVSTAKREAPSYSIASIVNSASNQAGEFAPATYVSIYGSNLAYTTKSIAPSDIRGTILPTILPGTGVSVILNHVRTQIFYISPGQINILIPSDVYPGPADLQIDVDGIYGPPVRITIAPSAPALFQANARTAIAVHSDGSLLTPEAPGHPGEFIVLYATGLGMTVPQPYYGEIPGRAAQLKDFQKFDVLFNDVPLDRLRILYAGVTPGFAGLYQINLRLPDEVAADPEVRLRTADGTSKAGVIVPLQP